MVHLNSGTLRFFGPAAVTDAGAYVVAPGTKLGFIAGNRTMGATSSVTGADLKALGLKPGPRYRQILNRLLDARLNGDVRTAEEERALAGRLISA